MKLIFMIIEKKDLANFKAACSITPDCEFDSIGENQGEQIIVWFNVNTTTMINERKIIFELGRHFETLIWAETQDYDMANSSY